MIAAKHCQSRCRRCSRYEAYRAINLKPVDLLLVDASGMPQHALELQGSGHHLGPAATGDAIKKEALGRAGIGYAEVLPGKTPAEVRALIGKLTPQMLPSSGLWVPHIGQRGIMNDGANG